MSATDWHTHTHTINNNKQLTLRKSNTGSHEAWKSTVNQQSTLAVSDDGEQYNSVKDWHTCSSVTWPTTLLPSFDTNSLTFFRCSGMISANTSFKFYSQSSQVPVMVLPRLMTTYVTLSTSCVLNDWLVSSSVLCFIAFLSMFCLVVLGSWFWPRYSLQLIM